MQEKSTMAGPDPVGEQNPAGAGLFAAAAQAARQGQYREATRLLVQAEDAGECTTAEALDLQARIFAQQGMYADAENCWRKARQLDPTNPAYEQGIARLRKPDRPLVFPWRGLGVLVAVLVLGVLLWQTFYYLPALRQGQLHNETLIAQLGDELSAAETAAAGRNQELAARLDRLQDELQGQLKALETSTGSLLADGQVLAGQVQQLNREAAQIQASLRGLHQENITLSGRMDAVDSEIQAVTDSLVRSDSRLLGAVESSLVDLQNRVEALRALLEERSVNQEPEAEEAP